MDRRKQRQICGRDARRFFNRLTNPYIEVKEQRLANAIGETIPGGGGSVLEVGCGEGSNLRYLQNRSPHLVLVGVDLSSDKMRFMQAHVAGARGVVGDALQLPFRPDVFDVVLCRDLLHHVYWDQARVVSEALRVVRPGGRVVVVEADGRKPLNWLFSRLVPREEGLRRSSPEQLMHLCSEFGHAQLEYLEASFLVRAIGSVIGWPKLWGVGIAGPIYGAARIWEKLIEVSVPRQRWTYLMITLLKTA